MKKFLFTIAFAAVIHSFGMAQSSSSVFNNGDNLLNIGIGVGSPFFGSGYSASIPVNPTITYEKGVTDAISVGATFSYASSKYTYSDFTSDYTLKESAIYIGARGSYHFNQLINLDNNLDLYGGASLGYVIVSVSDNQGDSAAAASAAGFGLFAGAKYFFAPTTGIYAELGYESLSYLNIGITFKF